MCSYLNGISLSQVLLGFQPNLRLLVFSGLVSDHNGKKLGPELALFIWRKISVHKCLFAALRLVMERTDLIPT